MINITIINKKKIKPQFKEISTKDYLKIQNWWKKLSRIYKDGLTFQYIDEIRSYKGLTIKEIEIIYKQINKNN